jgi:hypothetical protein
MTDLLTRDEPSDTGEIPRIDAVGEGTRNLQPYLHGLPPALRRPTAALPIYVPQGACRRIDWDDDEFQGPQPKPAPIPAPPKPKVDDEILWDLATRLGVYKDKRSVLYVPSADRKPGPRGRHRKPAGPLRTALASAWARVRGAM